MIYNLTIYTIQDYILKFQANRFTFQHRIRVLISKYTCKSPLLYLSIKCSPHSIFSLIRETTRRNGHFYPCVRRNAGFGLQKSDISLIARSKSNHCNANLPFLESLQINGQSLREVQKSPAQLPFLLPTPPLYRPYSPLQTLNLHPLVSKRPPPVPDRCISPPSEGGPPVVARPDLHYYI